MSYIFKLKRKVGFLVIDLTWRVFSQTGNIETYLLMKELENEPNNTITGQTEQEETSMDSQL
jgi:hypothetical protein|nr:YqzL family protein [Oceanobacillus jordanicus]